jgi:hypothetical protein
MLNSNKLTKEEYNKKCKISDDESISLLKKELKSHSKNTVKPSNENVILIVSDILSNAPLKKTAKKFSKVANAENFILDIVATFGTWLTHSEGKVTTEFVLNKDLKSIKNIEKFVVIPDGYEPNASHGRDLLKALTAILVIKPSDETVVRFVSRTYRNRTDLLDYPLIAGVWKFATIDRLNTIKNVNQDEVFYSQVIASYELLNKHIDKSNDIVKNIVLKNYQPKKLISELAKVIWLNETEFSKILIILTKINLKTNQEQFDITYNSLVKIIKNDFSRYYFTSIRELSAGQVRRICEAEGLIPDESEKIDELEIRNNLKSLGLIRDADVLVPEAIRAYQKGLSSEFWAVMNARAEGDLSWTVMLQELSE